MQSPAVRIQVIEASLRCFVFGWLSLIPLIGLPFVLLANHAYLQSRAESGLEWNPASGYRRAGQGLSCLGGFLQFLTLGAAVIALLNATG
jgi:hypothetical protein